MILFGDLEYGFVKMAHLTWALTYEKNSSRIIFWQLNDGVGYHGIVSRVENDYGYLLEINRSNSDYSFLEITFDSEADEAIFLIRMT